MGYFTTEGDKCTGQFTIGDPSFRCHGDFGDVYGMFYAITTDGVSDEELMVMPNW